LKHTLTRHRVLVVDDNVDAAQSLGMLLKLSGQDVVIAHDGMAALERAIEHRPQLVLLDIGMPGMDGYEVCRRLRDERVTEKVVVVALTGWGQEEDRVRSLQAGFDYHFVKPVDWDTLGSLLVGLDEGNK
jgi:two-component system CheB/CheR fusion protein